MKTLYILVNNMFTGNYAFGEPMGKMNFAHAPKCSVCGNIIGMRTWLPPYLIKLDRGTKTYKPGDILFGIYDDFIASPRFKEVWEKENLKGIFEWRPVEVVRGKYKGSLFYYPRLKPAAALADFTRTKVAWGKEGPPNCQECLSEGKGQDAVKGIFLFENSIPNDDLFHAKGLLTEIIASERFKKVVKQHGLLNVELVPSEDYSWDPKNLLK